MHDPMTQAWRICFWYRWSDLGKTRWRYWVPFITIWHKDPEKRGSDDSCGWFTPPFSDTTREIVKSLADEEAVDPMLFANDETPADAITTERYVFGSILLVSRCLVNSGVLPRFRAVTVAEATKWAAEMTYNRVDSFLGSFWFKSGYHSNWHNGTEPNTKEQDRHWREEQARSFYGAIAGLILRSRRPWFLHPRWHVWHWSLQIHPLEHFKRWAFSRCSKCGGRFKWGASVCTNSWNSAGPSWKGERDVFHMDCDRPGSDGVAAA